MPKIAGASIQEVKDKLDAVAVVADFVRLENRGGRYWGCCPFHSEKTPSFTVNPDLKTYYCFGCQKGGTVIGFLMEMDKLSFPEAVEALARRFAVPLVYENGGIPVEETRKNEELFELYRRTAGTFHHILTEKDEGGRARNYLLSRKISAEMVEGFHLGYAPADRRWLHRFLRGKGYSDSFLAGSGLFSAKYPGICFFAGRLVFPIADRQGRTVAFGGRILPPPAPAPEGGIMGASEGDEGPKYLNSPETEFYKKRQTLFAVDLAQAAIKKTGEVYLAEGYMDVIALHQGGITNAVAPLGTAFTDEQAKLLRRWAKKVNLFLDTDEAGQGAAVKAILTCRRNGLAAGVVFPGAGGITAKDPAEILQKFGPEALQNAAKSSILDFDYLLNRVRGLFDLSSGEGKAQAAVFLFPYAETLESQVSRESCLASVADVLGVDRGAVLNDYRRFAAGQGTGGGGAYFRKEEIPQKSKPVRRSDELSLLVAVALNQARYPRLRTALSIKEVEDPAAKELFVALEECFIHDESGMDDLLSRISSEELRNFVIERGASKEFSVSPEGLEQFVSDGIRKVKRKGLERRLVEIDGLLRSLSRPAEGSMEELLAEKMDIHAELRRAESGRAESGRRPD